MSREYIRSQKDTQTYTDSCAHKKHSELVRQNRFFGFGRRLNLFLNFLSHLIKVSRVRNTPRNKVFSNMWEGRDPHIFPCPSGHGYPSSLVVPLGGPWKVTGHVVSR
jgi:hypothetical protein